MRWFSALLIVAGLTSAGENARHHFRLALRSGGTQARHHYFAVLRLEPGHRAARRALRSGGRAVANDAMKLLWRKDPADRAVGLLVIDLLPPAERQRALAIAGRNRHVEVRKHAAAALTDPAALARIVVRDRVADVRAAAVASLRGCARPSRYLVGALRSGVSATRLRAIEALGDLGESGAIGPLVAQLTVSGGSGQQVYIAQTNQVSFIQDFDVEVAATAFIADPSTGVIQDGVAFSFRALGHSGTRSIHERRAVAVALAKLIHPGRPPA